MSNTKWPSMDDLKEAEHNRLRHIAFVAVSIASASLFVSVIGLVSKSHFDLNNIQNDLFSR